MESIVDPGAVRDALARTVSENGDELVRFLRRLVKIPSLPGEEGSAADKTSVAGQLTAFQPIDGLEGSAQTVAPGSDNVVELLRGSGNKALILVAHTDIVPPGDKASWFESAPLSGSDGEVVYLGDRHVEIRVGSSAHRAEIRDQMDRVWQRRGVRAVPILYGRGTFDNKGSVTAVVGAMRALAQVLPRHGCRLGGDLIALYSVGEETDGPGARAFCEGPESWLAQHGYLVVNGGKLRHRIPLEGVALDGSYGWMPVVGHRGSTQSLIRLRGRASHASTPHLGVNAVTEMARVLCALDARGDDIALRLKPFMENEILGAPTFAIGTTIAGGGINSVDWSGSRPVVDRGGVNAIPEWCEATVDVRYPPNQEYPSGTEKLPDIVVQVLGDLVSEIVAEREAEATVEKLGADLPCVLGRTWKEAEAHPLVQASLGCARSVLGYDPGIGVAPGGTDATFLTHHGQIPTLVEFGPAGALSHQPHEYVERDHIPLGAVILAQLAVDRLGLIDT